MLLLYCSIFSFARNNAFGPENWTTGLGVKYPVALEALRGELTVAEIAGKYQLSESGSAVEKEAHGRSFRDIFTPKLSEKKAVCRGRSDEEKSDALNQNPD